MRGKVFSLSILSILVFAGILGDFIIKKITLFSDTEMHPHLIYTPPGTLDVPQNNQSYEGKKEWFEIIDIDKSKKIECEKIRAESYNCPEIEILNNIFRDYILIWTEIFNKDKKVSVNKIKIEHLNEKYKGLLVEKSFNPANYDKNHNGFIEMDELIEQTRFMRINEDVFVQNFDENNDLMITKDEFGGIPQLKTFILGGDGLGRDIFSRLIKGLRISLLIGIIATIISSLIGITYGAIAGYSGGFIDALMMRIVDIIYGLPFIFVVILLLSVAGPSTINLFIALSLVQWLTMARIVRGQVLSIKERDFVEAARSVGSSNFRILTKHIIPNAFKPIVSYSIIMVSSVIKEETFLSFLGIRVQPPQSSLGILIGEGAMRIDDYPHLLIPPAIVLFY